MNIIALLHLLCLRPSAVPAPAQAGTQPALIRETDQSGRCVTLAESSDSRVETKRLIAPGQPPVLTFRYYEGKLHHRFNNSDLMLDDAGH